MEVNTSNANSFAPKLGSASPQTFASDTFSTHLRENQSEMRQRTDDRHSAAERQSAQAEKAEAAADATEERRAARARDREDDMPDRQDRDTTEDRPADEPVNVAGAHPTPPPSTNDQDENSTFFEDIVKVGLEEEHAQSLTALDATDNDTVQSPTPPLTEQTQADVSATKGINSATNTNPLNGTETGTTSAGAIETSEAEIAARSAAANAGTIAVADTTADSQASKPTGQSGPAANHNAQQETTPEDARADRAAALSDLTEKGFSGDADNRGDGEKSLGQQAVETLASKNKPNATSTAPANAGQAAAPAPPAAPPQALAALGLNAPNLTSDIDLELLGLNVNGPGASSASPQSANPVLVRFGALPGQAQATQVPNTAIALQIAKHVSKGVSTFEIRLDPPEMGRIDIKLELSQDGRVTAHLAIEKSETLDLMQRDSKSLEQALRDAGLDVDSDALNFSLQNGNDRDDANLEQNADGTQTGAEQEDTQQANIIKTLAARQIDAAARGGIDVSI